MAHRDNYCQSETELEMKKLENLVVLFEVTKGKKN
jgi:hypothetical protein